MECPKTGRVCVFRYCKAVLDTYEDPSEDYKAGLAKSYGEVIGGVILSTTHCSLLRDERLEEYIANAEGSEDDLQAATQALELERLSRNIAGSDNPN